MVDKFRLASILTVLQNYEKLAETRAPMAPELESAFAELLALRRDIALSNDALAACQSQAAGRIRVLEAALAQALENIKVWHNMGGADGVWPIYYRSAPEMRLIREAMPPCFSPNGREEHGCTYCGSQRDADGTINHRAGCAGTETRQISRLRLDWLRAHPESVAYEFSETKSAGRCECGLIAPVPGTPCAGCGRLAPKGVAK